MLDITKKTINRIRAKMYGKNLSAGFTIIELVTVIAIFGIMTSITLFNFKDYSKKVDFDNLVQDIALTLVGAQKAALSGSTINQAFLGDDRIKPGYGVYFKVDSTGATSKNFVYFNDLPNVSSGLYVGNKFYDTGTCPVGGPVSTSECVTRTSITTGAFVSGIYYVKSDGTIHNSSSTEVHITFTRPFPDATINIGNTTTYDSAKYLCLEVFSDNSSSPLRDTIIISNLGQIRTVASGRAAISTCH